MRGLILLLFLWLSLLSGRALALEPLVIEEGMEQYRVGKHLEILEDEEGAWQIEDVTAESLAERFEQSLTEVPGFGFDTSAFWFHLKIRSRLKETKKMLLEVDYPMLDKLDLYLEQPDGRFTKRTVGDTFLHGNKIIRHSTFLFPLLVEPGQQLNIYLRLRTQGSAQLPLTLWMPEAFWDHEHTTRIGYGIFYGLLIILTLYNLFLFIATRFRTYLLSVIYVTALFTFLSSNDGLAQEYLWPSIPWLANRVIPLSLWMSSLFVYLTTMDFLELKDRLPRWHRTLKIMSSVTVVGVLGSFIIPYNPITRLGAFWVAPCVSLAFAASVHAWRIGYREARFFAISWFILFLGTVLISFSRLGLIGRSWLTESAWVLGFGINIVFVSLSLTDRVNIRRREKEQAQAEALEKQRQAAKKLERQVRRTSVQLETRTRELAETYDQLANHFHFRANFLSTVTHELRGPLETIIARLQALIEDDSSDASVSPKVGRRLRSVIANAQRLRRTTNQLLDLARLEVGGMPVFFELLDVQDLVAPIVQAFEQLARSRGIHLVLNAPEGLRKVYIDPYALENTLCNLLSNALKFAEPGSTVVVRLTTGDTSLDVSIWDTGIGIDEENLPRVFNWFFQVDRGLTRRHEGAGIGLALSRQLVELTGGQIDVQSKTGVGSTFTVSLPLGDHVRDTLLLSSRVRDAAAAEYPEKAALALEAEVGKADAGEESIEGAPAKERADLTGTGGEDGDGRPLLLAAAPNRQMRLLVEDICGGDFRIAEAADGKEALELISKLRPSLVIADVMMPRMDGYDLLRQIRLDPISVAIPVVLLDVGGAKRIRLRGHRTGIDDILVKPFESRELRSRVRNMLLLQQQEMEIKELKSYRPRRVTAQASREERARRQGRYLSPSMVKTLMAEGDDLTLHMGRQRLHLTFFRLALRGVGEMAKTVEKGRLGRALNDFLTEIVEVAHAHGATLDRCDSEAVTGFFGAPRSEGARPDAIHCAKMAITMWQRATESCDRWKSELLAGAPSPCPPVATMILSSGEATVGSFGAGLRHDYTAVGGPADETTELLPHLKTGQLFCTMSTWNMIHQEISGRYSGEVALGEGMSPLKLYSLDEQA